MSKERPKITEMKYHYGWKMRCFPSTKQMQMIQKGIDASRFVYNEMVARNKDIYFLSKLNQVKPKRGQNGNVSFGNPELDWFFLYRTIDRFWELWRNRGQLNRPNNGCWKDAPLYAEYLTRLVKLPLMEGHYRYIISTQARIKERFDFLQDKMISSTTLGLARKSYSDAWKLWKKANKGKVGVPRFKRKDLIGAGTMRLSNGYEGKADLDMYSGSVKVLDRNHIKLPKIGRIRVTKLGNFLDNYDASSIRIGTTTISKDNLGNYWVSFQLGSMQPFKNQVEKTNKQLGIDLNLENFLTSSDGVVIENPRFYRNAEKYLKAAKRKLSRRQLRAKKEKRSLRGSKNYQKQRLLVAKKMKRISNQRNSFLDKLSLTLIKNHDLVVAEELRSKNMLRNHALAMSIADVGWRTFLQKLTYKAELYGHTFITVDPKNTTQTCHDCGYIMGSDEKSKRLGLNKRKWTCPECDVLHIRDVNAAQNILAKGQLALA